MALTEHEINQRLRRIRLQKKLVPDFLLRPNRSVFDDLKCVFVHVPKTAGTSIRSVLESHRRSRGKRYPRLRTHSRAFEYRAALGDDTWGEYFSFAVIRNPYDLMVSSYFWWLEYAQQFRRTRAHRRRVQAMADFSEFVHSDYGRFQINEFKGDIFDWIAVDGEIIVDYVARMETLAEDWRVICDRIGIPHVELPHRNVSSRGKYRKYYDDESREIVARRFRRTIDRFGYEF